MKGKRQGKKVSQKEKMKEEDAYLLDAKWGKVVSLDGDFGGWIFAAVFWGKML